MNVELGLSSRRASEWNWVKGTAWVAKKTTMNFAKRTNHPLSNSCLHWLVPYLMIFEIWINAVNGVLPYPITFCTFHCRVWCGTTIMFHWIERIEAEIILKFKGLWITANRTSSWSRTILNASHVKRWSNPLSLSVVFRSMIVPLFLMPLQLLSSQRQQKQAICGLWSRNTIRNKNEKIK